MFPIIVDKRDITRSNARSFSSYHNKIWCIQSNTISLITTPPNTTLTSTLANRNLQSSNVIQYKRSLQLHACNTKNGKEEKAVFCSIEVNNQPQRVTYSNCTLLFLPGKHASCRRTHLHVNMTRVGKQKSF